MEWSWLEWAGLWGVRSWKGDARAAIVAVSAVGVRVVEYGRSSDNRRAGDVRESLLLFTT